MSNSNFKDLGLDEKLLKLLKLHNISKPTEVQASVIPELIKGKNVIVKAHTGSGKTLTFLLPLLQMFIQNRIGGSKGFGLILSPTRELALQTEKVIRDYSENSSLRVVSLHGGQKLGEQKKMLEKNFDILNCAPGRLIDFSNSGQIDLEKVKYCVIDEGDRLMELGFYEDIKYILMKVPTLAQRNMFSATYHNDLLDLAKQHMLQPLILDISKEGSESLNIAYYDFRVEDSERFAALMHLLEKPWVGQTVIFVKGKSSVVGVAAKLKEKGILAESFHADLDIVERDSALRRFKNEMVQILVASDLAARGLDISGVKTIINYHIPDDVELYIHRTGRTGRAFEKGSAYTLTVSDKETLDLSKWHKNKHLNEIKPYKTKSVKELDAKEQKGNVYYRTIVFNRGKRDKFTPGHFVGFLCGELEIAREQIGNVNVYEDRTEIEMTAGFANKILNTELVIKGKKILAEQKEANIQKRYKTREIATRTQKSKKFNDRQKKK